MIGAKSKRLVRSRYVMRCGYCGISEQDVGATLTFDHYRPRIAAGTDAPDNLVYACHACNEYKGDYWHDGAERLLHPLHDNLSLHIQEQSDGILIALDGPGAIYIAQMRLNRTPLVNHRVDRKRLQIVLAERAKENALLEEILQEIQELKSSRLAI